MKARPLNKRKNLSDLRYEYIPTGSVYWIENSIVYFHIKYNLNNKIQSTLGIKSLLYHIKRYSMYWKKL